jgi:Predicted membrane protein
MELFLRGVAIYLFLLAVFRVLGKRSLAETTTFDFVLLLIVGEATQQALLGNDFSVTNALVLITVLMGIDMVFSKLKGKYKKFDRLLEGTPLILVDHGKPLQNRMREARVDTEDIMEAARLSHGLEQMKQIKYAVLERDGQISIIPLTAKT